MKPHEIQIGKTYVNRGAGKTRRPVMDIGFHIEFPWRGLGEPPKEEGLVFQQNGRNYGIGRSSFAAWAGKEAL